MKKMQATVAISVSPRSGHEIYPLSSRESNVIEKRRPIPKPLRPHPAKTNTAREAGDASNTTRGKSKNHPASNSTNPTTLIPKAPPGKARRFVRQSRRRLKYHNRTPTSRTVPINGNTARRARNRAHRIRPAERSIKFTVSIPLIRIHRIDRTNTPDCGHISAIGHGDATTQMDGDPNFLVPI